MKQLFFISLGIILMLISIYSVWTSTTNNEVVGSVTAFILSAVLAFIAVLDYDYQTKHNRL
jgi:NADH:ubiquinone oxidoreductase subunit K